MKASLLAAIAALTLLAFAPYELLRIEREVEGYQAEIDEWRADGTAYLSIPMYLGIDSAELLIREIRGDLEHPREREVNRDLAELRSLMKDLEKQAKELRPYKVPETETYFLLSGRNVRGLEGHLTV